MTPAARAALRPSEAVRTHSVEEAGPRPVERVCPAEEARARPADALLSRPVEAPEQPSEEEAVEA
ncbi:hypothetical protein [Streptomyces sp. NPDC051776]|uniref:hypothetical protein n=1 Tax=Streptomyces sp. NPDC051776 TaxID=3155414 RepID=UPI003445A584